MDTYDAWELDDMIARVESMESKIAEHKRDYNAREFEIIMDNLSDARESLYTAWMMI